MKPAEPAVESPCNRICVLHPTARLCLGCGRSIDEIAHWAALGGADRRRIAAQLPARLAGLCAAENGGENGGKSGDKSAAVSN